MPVWITVTIAYAAIAMVGVALGAELSRRFPGKGGPAVPSEPVPPSPLFGVELGSDFDRELLPDAFPAPERVVQ